MKRTVVGWQGRLEAPILVCILLLLAVGALNAQPVIDQDGIVNNASYMPFGLPNSGIAQGSIFAVFGKNLGPSALQQASAFPLPTQLGGTSIRATVGGTSVDAIILYASAGQVGAILPSNTPPGNGTLTVTFGGQTSAAMRILVVRSAVGIFTINQAGSGPAVVTTADYVVNVLTEAARPGQPMILWTTGLGPVTGNEAQPPVPADLNFDVVVLVGGKPAKVLYKGRSGCCAGLDQIVFEVPSGVEGCYVPIVVKVGGVLSNFGSMSIASSGKVCSDPTGFSADDLTKLQGGATFSVGEVLLNRTSIKFSAPPPIGTIDMKTDSGAGTFVRYAFGKLIGSQGVSGFATFGSCLVVPFRGTNVQLADPVRPDPLDAGPVLNLSGPKGAKQITKQSTGSYSSQIGGGGIPGFPGGQPDYLDPGTYTVDNGSGGNDVGPFRATLAVPTLLVWTNQDSINDVSRSQGLPITWSGGDPNKEYVTIIGISTRSNPDVGAVFMCTERASAGSFTVPSDVLSFLPASEVKGGVATGLLTVGSSPVVDLSNRFNARGLDVGFFSYNVSSSKSVNYR